MQNQSRSVFPFPSVSVPPRHALAEELTCPFALRICSHVQAAHEHSVAWLDGFFADENLKKKAEKARMAWMVAGFYPDADGVALDLAADYLCWAFALDDLGDETSAGERPAALAELFERFDAVFEPGPRSASEEPSVRALRDVVARLARLATPEQVEAFRVGNRAYFGGMLWEAHNRSANWVPNESSYLGLRPAAGAVPPFFALIEPLQRIRLRRATKMHPAVQELERLAGGIVCWVNDVLSYEKERSLGDVHNLAIVYEIHRQLDPASALREAIRFNNAEVNGFVERMNALPSFDADEDREVRRYVETLGSMIRITRDWTLGSARYAGTDRLRLDSIGG